MRIAFLADVHVANHKRLGGEAHSGINARANRCLVTLDAAIKACKDTADVLVVCGDLFDSVRPEPQIIAAVASILGDTEQDIYLLRGNHEMVSDDPGDHSLGPLAALPGVHVVEEPTLLKWAHLESTIELLAVPFYPGSHEAALPGILESALVQGGERGGSPPASPLRLLALHSGIRDKLTEAWLQKAPDSIDASALYDLMVKHGISAAVAGHWHKHRAWDFTAPEDEDATDTRRIAQLGALVPTGWNNPGVEGYGTVAFWDSKHGNGKLSYLTVPGPRFLIGASEAEAAEKAHHKVFVRWPTLTPEEEKDAVAALAKLKKSGVIVGGEVEQDRADSEIAARSAAMVARSADTLAEALAAFVAEMPLPEGVSRESVLEKAKRYLEG